MEILHEFVFSLFYSNSHLWTKKDNSEKKMYGSLLFKKCCFSQIEIHLYVTTEVVYSICLLKLLKNSNDATPVTLQMMLQSNCLHFSLETECMTRAILCTTVFLNSSVFFFSFFIFKGN